MRRRGHERQNRPVSNSSALALQLAEAELETLHPRIKELARILAILMPSYRYDLSRLPRIEPPPAPGLPSAIEAAKAIWHAAADSKGGAA
jgi:hypothetical protein